MDKPVVIDNVEKEPEQASSVKPESLNYVLFRLCDMSYEMEMQRYDSMTSVSSQLLTCISIASIALATLLPTLLDVLPAILHHQIGISYLMVFGLLLASFVVALFARYRFRYLELASPSRLSSHMAEVRDEFEDELECAQFYCESLEESYRSIRKRNELLSRLLKLTTILLVLAVAVLLILIICGMVAYSYIKT